MNRPTPSELLERVRELVASHHLSAADLREELRRLFRELDAPALPGCEDAFAPVRSRRFAGSDARRSLL